jgi:hypothetical protein
MSYIGADYTQQLTTPAIDYFSGNGVTTTFTLTRSVTSVFSVEVVVNGVQQNPRTAYTINQAGNLVFDGAPSAGTNNIYVMYNSQVGQFVTPSPGTVNPRSLSFDGNGAFVVDGVLSGLVTENIQTSNYTITISDRGRAVVFNNSSAVTVTIPADSAQNFPIGSVVYITKVSTGSLTLAGAPGVTISKSGNLGTGEELYVRKRAANTWIVVAAPTNPTGTGGSISNSGIYTVHQFTSPGSGTFTLG